MEKTQVAHSSLFLSWNYPKYQNWEKKRYLGIVIINFL